MFRNADRVVSDQLLGRQRAHWSFFTDSDGSVMEGNEIEDLGGGTFRTVSAAEKYSRLDLYAMGLATEAEVPRWFFIEAPISDSDREDAPRPGVTITGTRRDVLIQDVVDALGPRVPGAADTPRLLRQATCSCDGRAPFSSRRTWRVWDAFARNSSRFSAAPLRTA